MPKDCGLQIQQPICNTVVVPTETNRIATNTICTNRLVAILPPTIQLYIG